MKFKIVSMALLSILTSCSTSKIELEERENLILKANDEKALLEDAHRKNRIEDLKRREQVQLGIYQEKFKMPFCSQKQLLYTSLVQPQGAPIEENCIYQVVGNPLTVLQSINQGILLTFNQYAGPDVAHIVFYIKTKRAYVDNGYIQNMLVKSTGIFKYRTLLGQEKTVYAFQFLDDYNF